MAHRDTWRSASCWLSLVVLALSVPLAHAGPASVGTADAQAEPEQEEGEEEEDALQQRLTEREDRRRPLEPFTVDVAGRPLTLGGEYEIEWEALWPRERDETTTRSDRALLLQGLEGEAFYTWGKPLSLFAQVKLAMEEDLRVGDYEDVSDRYVERGEMWLYSEDIAGSGINLDLGRLNFEDDRRWWWDRDLDAVRVEYEAGRFDISLAFARELGPYRSDRDYVEPEDDRVQRWIMESSWNWAPNHTLQLFALRQDDRSRTEALESVVQHEREDESDARLTWWGARAMGVFEFGRAGAFGYWFDWARVHGSERTIDYEALSSRESEVTGIAQHDVRGHAFDVGLNWLLALAGEPRLFAGYARGSGDAAVVDSDGEEVDDGVDHSFRQTSLHANEAGFGGVQRFPHYGVLLDPELSNLRVQTLGAGLTLLRSSSLDLVHHRYRLEQPATSLREARVEPELDGQHRDLGRAFDLVLALEEWERFEFEAVLSAFRSGDAFVTQPGVWSYGAFVAMRIAF